MAGNLLPGKRPALLAGLLLAALVAVFFARPLIRGEVLSAWDFVYASPAFSAQAPDGYVRPSNALLFDQVHLMTCWRHFAWRALRAGHLPLWNPHGSSGNPQLATLVCAALDPLNMLMAAVPFPDTFLWSAMLRLLAAGAGMYGLMRAYRLSQAAALVAAVSFMFCGFLVVWLGYTQTNVAVLLPAIIWACERLVQARKWPETAGPLAVGALLVAAAQVGGHVETAVDVLFGAGAYTWVRLWQTGGPAHGERWRTCATGLAKLFAMVLLGTIAAGLAWAPFVEWLPDSTVWANRQARPFLWFDPAFFRHLLSSPLFIFPNLFNNPTWRHPYWSFLLNWGNFHELMVYAGTLTALLAIVGARCARGPDRAMAICWLIVGGVSFGRAFHVPVVDWLNQLPVLRLGIAERQRLIVAFSVCVLGGYGAQALLDPTREAGERARRGWRRLCGTVIAGGLLLMLLSNLAIPFLRAPLLEIALERAEARHARAWTGDAPIEAYRREAVDMVAGLAAAFRPGHLAMYLPILWAAGGLLVPALQRRAGPRAAAAGLVALVAADLISFGSGYNPTIARSRFMEPPAFAAALQTSAENPCRVIALNKAVLPDLQELYGWDDLRGVDFTSARYRSYLQAAPGWQEWIYYGTDFQSADSPLLKALNLRYVVASSAALLNAHAGLRIVGRFGNVFLGEFTNVVPRAFMVHDAIEAGTDAEARQLLAAEPERVLTRVVLAAEAGAGRGLPERPTPSGSAKTGDADVRRLAEGYGESAWRVATRNAGWLFVSETYDKGWKAELDGIRVPVRRANLAFRAVAVPAGEHIVRFRYAPASLWWGGALSLCGLAGIAALAAMGIRARLSLQNNAAA